MNMSLNLPQPVKLGRRPGRKVGSDPRKVEKCLVLVMEAVNTRGSVPTNGELASALGCTHPTVISIWRALVAAGRIPQSVQHLREDNKHRTKPTSHLFHTGNCTAEMADKIYQLLKNDIEARICFFLMRRGILRKDL